jgi:hypothetical protein
MQRQAARPEACAPKLQRPHLELEIMRKYLEAAFWIYVVIFIALGAIDGLAWMLWPVIQFAKFLPWPWQ